MLGVFTICMEMFPSGVRIGTENTPGEPHLMVLKMARTASSVVAVGATMPLTAGLRAETGETHRFATTPSAFAWP